MRWVVLGSEPGKDKQSLLNPERFLVVAQVKDRKIQESQAGRLKLSMVNGDVSVSSYLLLLDLLAGRLTCLRTLHSAAV